MQRLPFELAVLFLALAGGGQRGDLRLLTIAASAENSQYMTGKRCVQKLSGLGSSRIEAVRTGRQGRQPEE